MEIVIGIFIGLSIAGILYFINWLRRPWLIPWDSKEWSEETMRKMQKAGWTPDEMSFVSVSRVVVEKNRGRRIVKLGVPPRVVKSQFRGKEIFVMMKKP